MKMTKEVVDKRRKKIMQEIQVKGTVNVDELATELNVTPLTIRRDLQYWEDMGAVERFYGGAKLVQQSFEHVSPMRLGDASAYTRLLTGISVSFSVTVSTRQG